MTVLILTLAMGLMAGALFAYSMHERRLNRHALVNIQAQNAARAVLEYASSQFAVQLNLMGQQSELLPNYIKTAPFNVYKNGTYGFTALYGAGGAPLSGFTPPQNLNNDVQTGSTTYQLWCSQPTPSGNFTIDRYDPRNANDPFRSTTDPSEVVSAQNIYLLAQATATDPNGTSVTDYATQVIQMRYESIFNFSIFYNVTMEFAPGAAMTVYGPVFSNNPAYITSDDGLSFTNTFQTAATFVAQPLGVGSGEAGRPVGEDVLFPNAAGTAEVSISDPTIAGKALNTWVDSYLNATNGGTYDHASSAGTTTNVWQTASNILWGTNVLTGVPPENLPGIPPSGAQLLIQPPNPALSPSTSAPATGPGKFDTGEQEKFSNLAGLYIVVTPTNSTTTGATGASVVAFYGSPGQVQTAALNYLYNGNPSAGVKATPAQRAAWLTTGTNSSSVLFSNNVVPINTPGGAAVSGSVAATATGSNTLAGIVNPTRLFYDTREQKAINAVDIDVGALANAITNNTLTTGSAGGTAWNINSTSNGWNGLVYVDVETDTYGAYAAPLIAAEPSGGPAPVSQSAYYGTWGAPGFTTTSDITNGGTPITGTGTETAVRLENGGTLPTAPAGSSAPPGFSFATNAPVYIVGTYNADGTLTGGAGATDAQVMTPDANEVPAMVAGDAIDILSTKWWSGTQPTGDANITSATGTNTGNNVANAASTEIAAAFIGGNVPTVTGTYNYSGGVENYMRLNENWGGDLLRYRGSIVALYQSTVATGAWPGTGSKTYGAPTRQWGYDNEFGVNHKYPPGSPLIPSMRRYGYTDINATTYNAMTAPGNPYSWTAQ
jgi:hypothetical protein